jgi:hypothetical protein
VNENGAGSLNISAGGVGSESATAKLPAIAKQQASQQIRNVLVLFIVCSVRVDWRV